MSETRPESGGGGAGGFFIDPDAVRQAAQAALDVAHRLRLEATYGPTGLSRAGGQGAGAQPPATVGEGFDLDDGFKEFANGWNRRMERFVDACEQVGRALQRSAETKQEFDYATALKMYDNLDRMQ
ncbi:hypothetical protein [Amycolatopsis nigrescens]|uniref:hypothetical protein n=1 Tax=Amycolatopsis nigrescens TaxID=381445 RepID=UPI00037077E8|nr:hypothetical protein [Amycolatopsis nigrescens]